MDLELAQYNMFNKHICASNVIEPKILEVMQSIKREAFVPTSFKSYSFSDIQIPLGFNQVMLQPKIIARILHELNITKGERILEIGTGSGYLTALLTLLGKQVTSIDIMIDLVKTATNTLKEQKFKNFNLLVGNGLTYDYDNQTFDVIVLTGSIPYLLDSFISQLNTKGRIFAVIGKEPIMEATIFTKTKKDSFTSNVVFETVFPSLLNIPERKNIDFCF